MWVFSVEQEVVRVFGPALRRHRPDVELELNKTLTQLRTAVRGMEDKNAHDLVLDCQVRH